MPVNTQIHRNGVPVRLRWGAWHLNMIEDMVGQTLNTMDGFRVPHDVAVCDPYDREEFFLYEGDILKAWYSSR